MFHYTVAIVLVVASVVLINNHNIATATPATPPSPATAKQNGRAVNHSVIIPTSLPHDIPLHAINFTGRLVKGTPLFEIRRATVWGVDVAVKTVAPNRANYLTRSLGEEINVTRILRHPNIVQYLGSCASPELCMISEFMVNGDVESYLSKLRQHRQQIPYQRLLSILTDSARALHWIHQLGYRHRDIKPANILLDGNYVAKLMDFGSHRVIATEEAKYAKTGFIEKGLAGTAGHMAPEVIREQSLVNQSADVWAFGIVMCSMIRGEYCWKGNPYGIDELELEIANHDYRPSVPARCTNSTSLCQLMWRCLSSHPGDRPTMAIVYQQLLTMETPEAERLHSTDLLPPDLNKKSNTSNGSEVEALKVKVKATNQLLAQVDRKFRAENALLRKRLATFEDPQITESWLKTQTTDPSASSSPSSASSHDRTEL